MNTIKEILAAAEIQNNTIKLTCGQIERNLYNQVNDVLSRLWGKWSAKQKVHVFNYDPTDSINLYLETGKLPPKNKLAYFPTPKIIIDDILADIEYTGQKILEPSAGQGAIAQALREQDSTHEIDCIEYSELNYSILKKKGFNAIHSDFLEVEPKPYYDYIIMNPPFSVAGDKKAYQTHILHAHKFLNQHGKIFCIVPPFAHLNDSKTMQFKNFIAEHCQYTVNYPAGTFKESGTMIATQLYCLYAESLNPEYFEARFDWFAAGNYGYELSREKNRHLSDNEYINFIIQKSWEIENGDYLSNSYICNYMDILIDVYSEYCDKKPEPIPEPPKPAKNPVSKPKKAKPAIMEQLDLFA